MPTPAKKKVASAIVASSSPNHTSKSAKAMKEDWADRENPKVLVLFDVDGTLSPSRKMASPDMLAMLKELKKQVVIGYVGGSDLAKQMEQLGEDAAKSLFDFGFSENGATAFRKGVLIGQESYISFLGEERHKELVNWTLRYIADLDIPIKRGTFIEFRNGMINVSPKSARSARQWSRSTRSILGTLVCSLVLVDKFQSTYFPKAGTRLTVYAMWPLKALQRSTFLETRQRRVVMIMKYLPIPWSLDTLSSLLMIQPPNSRSSLVYNDIIEIIPRDQL